MPWVIVQFNIIAASSRRSLVNGERIGRHQVDLVAALILSCIEVRRRLRRHIQGQVKPDLERDLKDCVWQRTGHGPGSIFIPGAEHRMAMARSDTDRNIVERP